jgi:hypothetical protein
MPLCFYCGAEIGIEGRVLRKDACPSCRRDLHSCRQCRFHDPGHHNQCREPKASMVRERDRANVCDYFEFAGKKGPDKAPEKEKTREALDNLFKKK